MMQMMKQSIWMVMTVIAFFVLSGCETMFKGTDNIANAAIANDMVMSGQVATTVKGIQLTDSELLTVDHAINHYSAFVDRWQNQLTSLDSSTPTFQAFLADYGELVKQYKSVENVVTKNYEKYSERDRVILQDYQERARKLNDSVDGLVSAGQRYQALLDALAFGRIMVGLAQAL